MTYNSQQLARAMTAIAAALAFSSTPLLAQETTPPDPATETATQAPATADPLTPAPAATETAVPPAPKPKIETTTARAERTARTASRPATRSTPRRAAATAPAAPVAAARAPAAEAPAPAPLPAEPQPPVAAAPAPPAPPAAEPATPAAARESLMSDLTSPDSLPIAGAAALGLLALGGAGLVARRRKRRRENQEFEARQQVLDSIGEEPPLELDRSAEIQPAPAFARTAEPKHDPVPAMPARAAQGTVTIPGQGNWESRPNSDLMFRRAGDKAKAPVEH